MRDIVAIGASAGGIGALRNLLSDLPPSYIGTLLIVVHIPSDFPSFLPEILGRYTSLPIVHARDGQALQPGHIYVAPPDQHLLLSEGVLRLWHGPKENWARPAVDPLFRSAAESYGRRVVGVVLSGMLYDGTGGLIAIKRAGGVALVQDHEEAQYASMPKSAISQDHPDAILTLAEIARTLVRLAQEPRVA